MSNYPSKQELIEHIQTLNGLIDGQDDSLGEMLTPIVAMLEKMVGPLIAPGVSMLAIGIHHDTGFVGSRMVRVPMTIEGISPVMVQPDHADVAEQLRTTFDVQFDTILLVRNDQVVHHWEVTNVDTKSGG